MYSLTEMSLLRRLPGLVIVSCNLGLALVAAQGPRPSHPGVAAPLGTISFPASGHPKAHAEFVRGVLWLHSFGYEEAIDAFRAAQTVDPKFVMAFWGEALSFNQPLWFGEEPDKARAVLARLAPTAGARAALAKTPREAMYLAAVDALYGAGDTQARYRAYAEAMASLAAQFPQDDEAQAFYALALLATLPRGDQALPLRERAGAIAEGVFTRNPQHPGASHYLLHAYDHAQLAARALPAARAYAKIAPAASHALHMPAHAFVQLGLWDEAAASDEASWEASMAWQKRKGLSVTMRDFHSLSWLQYEWTQQGRFDKSIGALVQVGEALKIVAAGGAVGGHHYADSAIGRGSGLMALRNDQGSMRARHVIESERWLDMKAQTSFDNVDELFALGMSAVKLRDLPKAHTALGLLQKADSPEQDAGLREQAAIMIREMEALIALAQGRAQDAFAAMDAATALQSRMAKPIGRPYPVKGADELYGEILLEAGRATGAIAWFERALGRTPNRSRAVLGLARAAAKAGQASKSRRAYQQFLTNWRRADPGLPELQEARAVIGRPKD